MLAGDEALALAGSEAAERQRAQVAARLAGLDSPAARPMRGDSARRRDFAYSLPVAAPVIDGLGGGQPAGISRAASRFATSARRR